LAVRARWQAAPAAQRRALLLAALRAAPFSAPFRGALEALRDRHSGLQRAWGWDALATTFGGALSAPSPPAPAAAPSPAVAGVAARLSLTAITPAARPAARPAAWAAAARGRERGEGGEKGEEEAEPLPRADSPREPTPPSPPPAAEGAAWRASPQGGVAAEWEAVVPAGARGRALWV
jgi:hypothetical protein